MNRPTIDELEMELRVLGRQLGSEKPTVALIEKTSAASAAHLARCRQAFAVRRRNRLLLKTALLIAATFPIPLLFLWGDWTAASALFQNVLSPAASDIASTVYLWVRFCALMLIYAIAIPAVAWAALRMNASNSIPAELSHS